MKKNGQSELIQRCITSTDEILSLLNEEPLLLPRVQELMNKRGDLINTLKNIADNYSEADEVTLSLLQQLQEKDKAMRETLKAKLNETALALQNVAHELKANKSYGNERKKNRFITGKLEG